MIKNCIDKENILDLIYLYIQFIITYWGQNILSPPPIFLNGGSDTHRSLSIIPKILRSKDITLPMHAT